MLKLDKIFNGYSLAIINAVIIMAALMTGNGMTFIETGLIHVIALLFVAISIWRIFSRPYTYDPIFEKFVHAALFALIVFAGSHIMEFVSMVVLHRYGDSIFANVANLYLIATFALIIGASHFLKIGYLSSIKWLRGIAYALIGSLLLLVVALMSGYFTVSLEADRAIPYVYLSALVISTGIALFEMIKIRKAASVTSGFVNSLMLSVSLIMLAVVPYVLYDVLGNLGVGSIALVYSSHFIFYAALSIFFLGFRNLSWGGIYQEVREMNQNTTETPVQK